MAYLLFKALISGVVIAIVSEIAQRNPSLGGLVGSLPLVSVLTMIWLWFDTGDAQRIAAFSQATFWFVLPSLPLLLIVPVLLRNGIGLWVALACGCAVTMGLYAIVAFVLAKSGMGSP